MSSDLKPKKDSSSHGGDSSAAPSIVPPSGISGGPDATQGGDDSLLHPRAIAGRKLGQYTILEKIGQGGMGSVFKAFDTLLERTVALKVLFTNPLDDPKQAERFMREARSMARLNHPNLLHVYNVGIENDCYYFVMELLEGDTLAGEIKRRRRIDPRQFIDWMGQVLSALHYVHLQGVTHRDIKSGNIMLCGRRAVLMDFGLAKDDHFSGLTSVGAVLGTPDYMSPESAEGNSAGPPTDIYSLGVVAYEALAGTLPFSGRSAMSIIRQHMDMPPPPIETNYPEIHPLLASAIHKCLAKKSTDRFADCTALAKELVQVHSTPELEALADSTPIGSAFNKRPPPTGSVHLTASASNATLAGPASRKSGSLDATLVESKASASRPPSVNDTMTLAPGDHHHSAAMTVPDATIAADAAPAKKHQSPWFWACIGFFGMLMLVFFFAALNKRHKDHEWNGQPVLQNSPGVSGQKARWVEFHGDDPDPSKWYHIFERQQPDGTWKRERVSHSEAMGDKGGTLEFLPDGQEQR